MLSPMQGVDYYFTFIIQYSIFPPPPHNFPTTAICTTTAINVARLFVAIKLRIRRVATPISHRLPYPFREQSTVLYRACRAETFLVTVKCLPDALSQFMTFLIGKWHALINATFSNFHFHYASLHQSTDRQRALSPATIW